LKGAGLAIESLALLGDPSALLLLVGGPSGPDGPDELARLHALAADLGVSERVRFLDAVPHDELAAYYRSADVCLVPSRTESFGLVALEAAACGTPVVASGVGGLTTLVDHGNTGYLVDTHDGVAFAAPIAKILTDGELAAQMRVAAADRARRYSWSMTAARLRRLYGDLAARDLVSCA
jgi:D-inositol-3-phosphate glycosyltransferase